MNARRRRAHLTLAAIALALAGAWLRVDGTEPQPRWRRFRWFAATFGDERVERAALLVPVRLAGLAGEHDLQLDLGSSQTLLHGGSIHDVAPSFPLRAGATAVSGTMAGVPVAAEPVHVLAGFRATVTREAHMPTVGTLGLAFFERRVLVLDYPGRRFMVLADGAPIPPGLARRARFFPIVRRNGKLYVPIDIDGKAQTGAFFDTGASAFALVTSTRDWRSLTGLQGDEPSLQRRTGSSWDTEITLVGGAMRPETTSSVPS